MSTGGFTIHGARPRRSGRTSVPSNQFESQLLFKQFVFRAVEREDGLCKLAARWGVSEATIRGWRENGTSPDFVRMLAQIQFNTEERLELCRLLSRGLFLVEPKPEDATEPEGSNCSVHEHSNHLIAKAVQVQSEINAAAADGVITDDERARIDQANDQVIRATRRTRPGFLKRLWQRMR